MLDRISKLMMPNSGLVSVVDFYTSGPATGTAPEIAGVGSVTIAGYDDDDNGEDVDLRPWATTLSSLDSGTLRENQTRLD